MFGGEIDGGYSLCGYISAVKSNTSIDFSVPIDVHDDLAL